MTQRVIPELRLKKVLRQGEAWALSIEYERSKPLDKRVSPNVMNKGHEVALQPAFELRPPPASATFNAVPMASMLGIVTARYPGSEITTQQNSITLHTQLAAPSHWLGLTPLPYSRGWLVQSVFLKFEPSGSWSLALTWKAEPVGQTMPADETSAVAPSVENHNDVRSTISHFASQVMTLASASDVPVPAPLPAPAPAPLITFEGFSGNQALGARAWLRLAASHKALGPSKLVMVKLGQSVNGWQVIALDQNQVTLENQGAVHTITRSCVAVWCHGGAANE